MGFENCLTDQLQEVDFYVRLGFLDEARTKLNEIAPRFPGSPEISLRYSQIEEGSRLQGIASSDAPAEDVEIGAQVGEGAFGFGVALRLDLFGHESVAQVDMKIRLVLQCIGQGGVI